MSIFLSYNFAQINKNLEAQITKVKELSEKTVEQERLASKLEFERRISDEENKRKTMELESARNLQLSFLPKEIPVSDSLDVGFYMNTATEVGGDYYDIISGNNGTITIAVGDATGHGVKAGIMVAIVKGLLHELNSDLTSAEKLYRINNVIRSMQLGNLYMGLILLKIDNLCIDISSAGMPPALLYKAEENIIEEIIIKRMPLGATNKMKFETRKVNLKPGDILLILSDGLSELFNNQMEMFDYSRIKEILMKNAGKTSAEIICELKTAADIWRDGIDQADDMTFMITKCR
jgi:serine phosphatase RsbU (regulator of sigma subunit)